MYIKSERGKQDGKGEMVAKRRIQGDKRKHVTKRHQMIGETAQTRKEQTFFLFYFILLQNRGDKISVI